MHEKLFVIKDTATGNYLSEISFTLDKEECIKWIYTSYTGKCDGMRYYTSRERAIEVLSMLQKSNLKSKANKKMEVIEVDENTMVAGDFIFENIK